VCSTAEDSLFPSAGSETHFIEEWAVLTARHLSFYHPDNKAPSFRIHIGDVICARKLDDRERPSFPTYHFMEIETGSRMYYCMLQNETLLKRWTEFINDVADKFRAGSVSKSRGSDSMSFSLSHVSAGSSGNDVGGGVSSDPSDGYLHKSSVFKCKARRIMNCKK
jgi:hypothetical protein